MCFSTFARRNTTYELRSILEGLLTVKSTLFTRKALADNFRICSQFHIGSGGCINVTAVTNMARVFAYKLQKSLQIIHEIYIDFLRQLADTYQWGNQVNEMTQPWLTNLIWFLLHEKEKTRSYSSLNDTVSITSKSTIKIMMHIFRVINEVELN